MKSGRRGFLGGALGLAVAAAWVRPGHAAQQAGVGERLHRFYIAPAVHEFKRSADAMSQALKQMCQDPSSWQAQRLETDFRALVAAWSRIAFLRFGPLVQDNRFERVLFWPDPRGVMLRQIRPLLQGTQDLQDLRTHSVAVQGLPALEYVLFGEPALLAEGANAGHEAPCAYAQAVAANLAQVADALWQAWQPTGAYAKDFAFPDERNEVYRNEHEVLAEAIKALSTGLRFEADVKLRTALGAQQDKARPKGLPFWRSGMALFAIAEAAQGLAGFHEAAKFEPEPDWLARGLNQELRQSAEILQSHQGQVLRMAEDADLYRELTLVVLKLDNARRMVDEDLAAALGVGMGFNALDGD
ncbi:imelysin family protein [Pusillimonas sp. CC-YST705]|uniref:Imelysin family protein n=1 Tax=Mesopusillimonas faecipullorum TaxID=2755040 RepID=A0ABS8CBJ6_9BURK|nr:imelysin family protein [Mesopusillimonas faecipullorum]MCB5363406.1 imelysin family protein [Mesopusillimonas faecipullorum]